MSVKMANILRHLLLFLSLIVLISFATCDISGPNMNCEISCAFNYSQNFEEVGYCCRGCRLMRLADYSNYGGPWNENALEVLQMCSDSCANAYGAGASAVRVCQGGCKHEFPAVENRLHQLQLFYNEQSKYIHMFDMVNRLMSCHFQSFLHAPEQLFDRTGDRYYRARVVYVSSDGHSVRSVSVSRSPGTSVKTERHEVAKLDNGPKVTGRVMEGKSRLYTRMTRADPAVLLLFLFGFVLLIGLTVSLCYPTHHTTLSPAKPQKLSIYGDGDLLTTLDEDDTLIDIKPRAFQFVAAPLPAKHAF